MNWLSKIISGSAGRISVRRGKEQSVVPWAEVRVGDLVALKPGETLLVDGRVVRGEARVIQTLGPTQVEVSVGSQDLVLSGLCVVSGELLVRCDHPMGESLYAFLHGVLARVLKPVFICAGLPLLLLVLPVFLPYGRILFAVFSFAAAVSLVAAFFNLPLVFTVWRARQLGVWIADASVFRVLPRVTYFYLSGRGVLTRGRFQLTGVINDSVHSDAQVIQFAASLVHGTQFFLRDAILTSSAERGASPMAVEDKRVDECGIQGKVEGQSVHLGLPQTFAQASPPAGPAVGLEVNGELSTWFVFDDPPQESLSDTLGRAEREGLKVLALTTEPQRVLDFLRNRFEIPFVHGHDSQSLLEKISGLIQSAQVGLFIGADSAPLGTPAAELHHTGSDRLRKPAEVALHVVGSSIAPLLKLLRLARNGHAVHMLNRLICGASACIVLGLWCAKRVGVLHHGFSLQKAALTGAVLTSIVMWLNARRLLR
jgi:cation transport ATPase